jgi:hypothetical protein
MIRKRNDNPKPGRGIDGTEGEQFTKQYRVDPLNSNPAGDYLSPQGAGKYQQKSAYHLREKKPYEATEDSYEILSEVEANQPDSGNRAIKSRGQR